MRSRFLICFLCFLCLANAGSVWGWGLEGHKMITDRATRLLPTQLQSFYWANRNSLKDLCIDPDLRKDSDPSEGPKHYIDLEQYPAGKLPILRRDAIEKFGMDKLSKSGWVLWNTQAVYDDLVLDMKRKDYPAILRLSGDLSHYVADAHVPLHVTENYDGQLTDDTGIHARFESRLVEQFTDRLSFDPRPAEFIADVPLKLHAIVMESKPFVQEVFSGDRQNAAANRQDDGYHIALATRNHMPVVVRRMNDASQAVASFWYTAWVAAGRPDLPRVDFSELLGPAPLYGGESVFYEGRYLKGIPDDWPPVVRKNLTKIQKYIQDETGIRLAKVSWQATSKTFKFRVEAIENAGPVNAEKIRRRLENLVSPLKIRFSLPQ